MKQIRKSFWTACLVVSLTAGGLPAGQAFAEPVQTDSAGIAAESVADYDETSGTESETESVQPSATGQDPSQPDATAPEADQTEIVTSEPNSPAALAPEPDQPAAIAPEAAPPEAGILRVPAGGFLDVQDPDAEYYDAVYWAAENDIIPGTDDGYFGVNELCTSQQFVVWLWKMADKPEPQTQDNPFTDVSASDSYYQAALWAWEQGIISSDDGLFGVGRPCSRAQVAATFWKLAGCPLPQTTKNPFTDVTKKDECYNAVLWATENDMAGGCSGSSFRPQDFCMKQDIAVALYGYSKCDPATFYLPEMPQPSAQQHLMGVLVSWDPIGGAEDYRIYRKTASGSWQRIGDTLETSYLDRTPEEDTTYYYTVRCVCADGRRFKSYYASPGAKITTAKRIIRADQAPGPDRLTALLAEAEAAYKAAQEEEEQCRLAYEQALTELMQAQQDFDVAQAAVLEAETTVQEAEAAVLETQAAVQEAETAMQEAEAAVREAETAVQEAKAAMQANPGSYTQEQLLELEENLQAARDTLKTAQEAEKAAREALQEAQDALQTAQENLQIAQETEKSVQEALQEAQEKASAAGEALGSAQAKLQRTKEEAAAFSEALNSYIPATGIRFAEESYTLSTEESMKIPLLVEPENACEYDAIWFSSDESIASVDDYGVVTAHTCGDVQISAALSDGTQVSCTVRTLYYDVADSTRYYFDPVYWASEKNITKGYGNVYFGPDDPCTREQMVVFLWRMAGQPEPKTQSNPFSDVKKSAYYYKAVLWAVDQGITNGYDNGTFGVGKPCLREHLVTFLWRLAGKPLPQTSSNSFSDVGGNDYYYNAVLWAAENAITKGYADGSFGPAKDCLRQHTVTFLYRYSQCDPETFYLSAMPRVLAEKRLYSVQLTWTPVAGAEKYRVYRRPASGSWAKIADTTSTKFEDKTAAPKTTYYYTVRCISADGSRFKSSFESPGAKLTTPSVFPHNEAEMRQLVVDNADSYIGTKGQSAKHRHILDVFNQVQPDGAPMYLYSAWCAAFTSAMSIEVLGSELADKYFPLSYNCGTIIRKAVVMDIWKEKDSYVPKPGDWIIYDWDDDGYGEDITGADHVGIIKSVSGKTITVIEGNKSNACGYRTISVNGRYIRGYVTPKYADIL